MWPRCTSRLETRWFCLWVVPTQPHSREDQTLFPAIMLSNCVSFSISVYAGRNFPSWKLLARGKASLLILATAFTTPSLRCPTVGLLSGKCTRRGQVTSSQDVDGAMLNNPEIGIKSRFSMPLTRSKLRRMDRQVCGCQNAAF